MLCLKNPDVTPPRSQRGRGWHFVEADGTLINGGTRGDLLKNVMAYRVANGLPFAGLSQEVEDWICRNTQALCAPPRPRQPSQPRDLGLADVWRFLRAMVAWVNIGQMVDQVEADRRAEICAGCSRNVSEPPGCVGCSGIYGMISKIVGERRTRVHGSLGYCHVCGCSNVVQVWVPLDVLHKAGKLEYPAETNGTGSPACWKRPP